MYPILSEPFTWSFSFVKERLRSNGFVVLDTYTKSNYCDIIKYIIFSSHIDDWFINFMLSYGFLCIYTWKEDTEILLIVVVELSTDVVLLCCLNLKIIWFYFWDMDLQIHVENINLLCGVGTPHILDTIKFCYCFESSNFV